MTTYLHSCIKRLITCGDVLLECWLGFHFWCIESAPSRLFWFRAHSSLHIPIPSQSFDFVVVVFILLHHLPSIFTAIDLAPHPSRRSCRRSPRPRKADNYRNSVNHL
ncbi:hypothetical protein SDJN03_06055, partial [Cucurbita argyrosperma subsp. sororia]